MSDDGVEGDSCAEIRAAWMVTLQYPKNDPDLQASTFYFESYFT